MIDDVDLQLLASRDRSRAADLISEVFSPPIVVVALLTAVSLHASPNVPAALGWVALTTTFCAAIPYLLLLRSVQNGVVADRHLARRSERGKPLLVALSSVITGLFLLVWLDAPRQITDLVVAFVAGLIVMLPITVRWKASLHAAVAAGALTVIGVIFGFAATVVLVPCIALVAWARLRAGRHTILQLLVGAAAGAGIAGLVFCLAQQVMGRPSAS